MQTNLQTDGSSRKKVLLTSILFMGLGHIVHLKEYIKGAFYVLIELLMLAFSPMIIQKIIDMITFGAP